MENSNRSITVWWIDDDHADPSGPRGVEQRTLVSQAGPDFELVPIHPAEFEERTSELSDGFPPDLLLIDFRLGMRDLPNRATPLFARDGVTLRGATMGIESLRDTPAYLVSGVAKKAQTGGMDANFDWVLSHRQLTRDLGGAFLRADASDYRRLRTDLSRACRPTQGKSLLVALADAVIKLLDVPSQSVEPVETLLRQTVASVLRCESILDTDDIKLAPSRPRAIARWVRSSLLCRRGPLIDDLMAATMLGTTTQHFRSSILPLLNLDSIQYKGVFCSTASMTFWRQALLDSLLLASDDIELSPPSVLARTATTYFEVPEDGRARCRVCQRQWPEGIGFDEDDPTVESAVHWRCSREATEVDNPTGFDVARSFVL